MSDCRPERRLMVIHDPDPVDGHNWMTEPTPADLLAAVRRGVESGTIKGEVVETEDCVSGHRGHSSLEVFDLSPGEYLVIGPVSDGGSET